MAGITQMPSKSWSCSSLQAGLKRVNSNFEHLRVDDLTEGEMQQELGVPRH